MTPDLELIAEAIGSTSFNWEPLGSGGYTRSRVWRVTGAHGSVFAKEADNEGSLYMLRREALVYRGVRGPFLPSFVGFADASERAVLAVEFIENACWPPPYPAGVTPLFDALESVAAAEPPPELPAQGPRWSRWERVAADPEPFLGLGLCSRAWLESSLDPLIAAEADAVFEGDELVHNDVYSGNVCFVGRRVRVEGGTPPIVHFPNEGPFAAALSGHFAVEAPAPLPDWAAPESTLREDMAGDLVHALGWAAELLELPPLR